MLVQFMILLEIGEQPYNLITTFQMNDAKCMVNYPKKFKNRPRI